jgi:hypothetical protein
MKQKTKPKGKKSIVIDSSIHYGKCEAVTNDNDTWTSDLTDQILDYERIAEIYNRRFKK